MKSVLILVTLVSAFGVASCSTGAAAVKNQSSPSLSPAVSVHGACAPGQIDLAQMNEGRISGMSWEGHKRNADMINVMAHNTSPKACTISATPSWNVIDNAGNSVPVVRIKSQAKPGATVKLAPGDYAQLTMYWFGSGCAAPNSEFGIELKSPDGALPDIWPASTAHLYLPACPGHGSTSSGPLELGDTGWLSTSVRY